MHITQRWLPYSPEGCSLCKFMDRQKGRNSHVHHQPAWVEYRPPVPKGWFKDICPLPDIHHGLLHLRGRSQQRRLSEGILQLQNKVQKILYIFSFSAGCGHKCIYLAKGLLWRHTFQLYQEILTQAGELIGDYCSGKRTGCSGVLRSLPLQHFSTTIPESDPMKNAKHKWARCTRCYSRNKQPVFTSWYCPQCQVWLCHTGENTNCFMMWHAQHIPVTLIVAS